MMGCIDTANYTFRVQCPDFIHKIWQQRMIGMDNMSLTSRASLIAFNVVLVFTTICFNLLSVVTIRQSSQLRDKMCYYVILVQSTVDLGVGIVGVPSFIAYLATPWLGVKNCLVIISMILATNTLNLLSIFALTLITIERYIGVLHPYSYKYYGTKDRILIYSVVASLISFACTGTTILTYTLETALRYIPLMVLILLLFTVYTYTKIFVVVRKLDPYRNRLAGVEQEQGGKRRLLREIKHAKSCFLVVLCFALCYLPTAIAVVFEVSTNQGMLCASYWYWISSFNFLNSNFNSLLYFWNSTILRKEAFSVLSAFSSG